ncbi:response regulator transcription factor [Pikeienuella piscinae]|uniref:Regulatory protein VirG n=1 Tax=Pikeienuella piscinae TaxID=2748098 RepID=A0A7L5BY72_9RHOB|nr:response regulator transcription factor [Pikeienuella piscinae]QIE56692.1 response regulator transcription factor [Pikeienuella piscinae]
MESAGKILIVDDDADITGLLDAYLSAERYELLIAHSANEMWAALAETSVDLILLDIILPDADGFQLTTRLRSMTGAAIILISRKSENIDEIVGLELGADDYVTKPFQPRNLLARIRSVLRRYGDRAARDGADTGSEGGAARTLAFGRWRFDPTTHRLLSENGDETVLSANESALLRHMVKNAGTVLSRDELMEATTGRSWEYMDRTVDILIARLRKKVEDNPARPTVIKTVRGVGYVFSGDKS